MVDVHELCLHQVSSQQSRDCRVGLVVHQRPAPPLLVKGLPRCQTQASVCRHRDHLVCDHPCWRHDQGQRRPKQAKRNYAFETLLHLSLAVAKAWRDGEVATKYSRLLAIVAQSEQRAAGDIALSAEQQEFAGPGSRFADF